MIKVFLIEDERLVREALKILISKAANLKLVGEASTEKEAIAGIQEKTPQVVLLDINFPDNDGLHIAQTLLQQYPDLKIIILTAALHQTFPKHLLEIGAHAYFTKNTPASTLLQAIEAVFQGKRVIDPNVNKQLALEKIGVAVKSVFDVLSGREMEVMLMILRGHTIPEIAAKLDLSPKTVSTYHMAILSKLEVEHDVALLLLAIREGLVDQEWVRDEPEY